MKTLAYKIVKIAWSPRQRSTEETLQKRLHVVFDACATSINAGGPILLLSVSLGCNSVTLRFMKKKLIENYVNLFFLLIKDKFMQKFSKIVQNYAVRP